MASNCKTMKEKLLLCLALLIGVGSLMYIANNIGDIEKYFQYFQFQSATFSNEGKNLPLLLDN